MNQYRKYLSILIIIFILVTLTGCWDSTEIDEMAYVISLGLDKGEQNILKLTLQIAIPKTIAEGGKSMMSPGKGKGQKSPGAESTDTITVEARTILSGLNMVNSFISRQISVSHLKAVVISEELAREGIGRYLNPLARYRELRGTASMIVVRGSADEFLSVLKSVLETNPSKFIELTGLATEFTSVMPTARLEKFYQSAKSYGEQPIVILGGVNKTVLNENEPIPYREPFRKQPGSDNPNEGDYLGGDVPRKGI